MMFSVCALFSNLLQINFNKCALFWYIECPEWFIYTYSWYIMMASAASYNRRGHRIGGSNSDPDSDSCMKRHCANKNFLTYVVTISKMFIKIQLNALQRWIWSHIINIRSIYVQLYRQTASKQVKAEMIFTNHSKRLVLILQSIVLSTLSYGQCARQLNQQTIRDHMCLSI